MLMEYFFVFGFVNESSTLPASLDCPSDLEASMETQPMVMQLLWDTTDVPPNRGRWEVAVILLFLIMLITVFVAGIIFKNAWCNGTNYIQDIDPDIVCYIDDLQVLVMWRHVT